MSIGPLIPVQAAKSGIKMDISLSIDPHANSPERHYVIRLLARRLGIRAEIKIFGAQQSATLPYLTGALFAGGEIASMTQIIW
jgi:hypothetical protein